MVQSARVGGGVITGSIGICAQCRNKAEVAHYPYHPEDNPQPHPDEICESCYKSNVELEHKINAAGGNRPESHNPPATGNGKDVATGSPAPSSIFTPAGAAFSEERARLLAVIHEKATDSWVEKFIEEVVTGKVMKFDWKQIIQSERWFSVLDLRKFAIELDPNFEKPVVEKKKRRRQPQQ